MRRAAAHSQNASGLLWPLPSRSPAAAQRMRASAAACCSALLCAASPAASKSSARPRCGSLAATAATPPAESTLAAPCVTQHVHCGEHTRVATGRAQSQTSQHAEARAVGVQRAQRVERRRAAAQFGSH